MSPQHAHDGFLLICRYDAGKDNYIDLMELKLMMEKLEAPQTHLGLKNMIKEVDEDLDNKLSFREVRSTLSESQDIFSFSIYILILTFCSFPLVPADLQKGSSRRAGRRQWPQRPGSSLRN